MIDHQNEIDTIRGLFNKLVSGRQDYDFQPAAIVSHAGDYVDQPDRIRNYGRQVICARIMTLLASTRMTTQARCLPPRSRRESPLCNAAPFSGST